MLKTLLSIFMFSSLMAHVPLLSVPDSPAPRSHLGVVGTVPEGMDLTMTNKEPVDVEQIRQLERENFELRRSLQAKPSSLDKTGVATDAKTFLSTLTIVFIAGFFIAKTNAVSYLIKTSDAIDKGVDKAKEGTKHSWSWFIEKMEPVKDIVFRSDKLSAKPEAQPFIKKWNRLWMELCDTEEWHEQIINTHKITITSRDDKTLTMHIDNTRAGDEKKPWYRF